MIQDFSTASSFPKEMSAQYNHKVEKKSWKFISLAIGNLSPFSFSIRKCQIKSRLLQITKGYLRSPSVVFATKNP